VADGKLTTTTTGATFSEDALVPGKMEHLLRGTVTTRQIAAAQPRAMIFEFK
jgi:hypothetical protein